MKSVLFTLASTILLIQQSVIGYTELWPITNEMVTTSQAVINTLLPATGVTMDTSNVWQRVAYITDTFGPRFSGSQGLENALDYIRDTARNVDGLTVTEMPTLVPKWVRGTEWGMLLSPRVKKLHMVGLGMSANTSGVNITAPVFVVSGYDDLMANCSKAQGKILLINTPFTEYGITVTIRVNAGNWALQCGAVAALIRTVGPYSIQNPHTGGTNASSPIPSAAISLEDASQLARMQARGQNPVVSLYMESWWYPPSPSRNILIDLVGSERPNEYVVVSGHGDSWDIAEGAMDDLSGAVSAWEAVRTLKLLGIQPKRTVRAVVWVNEENGSAGGLQYVTDLNPTGALANHSFVFETDSGAFYPMGIGISCSCGPNGCQNGGCGFTQAQLSLIGTTLLGGIGTGNVTGGGGGTDIDPSCQTGVPCIGLNVIDPRLTPGINNPCLADSMNSWYLPPYNPNTMYDSNYFWFHHSEGDTIERMDPTQLNAVAASLAVWAYSVAQLPDLLPRDAPAPPSSPSNNNNNNSPSIAGPVAGGVVGGLIGIAVLFFAFKWVGSRSSAGAAAFRLSSSPSKFSGSSTMTSAAYSSLSTQLNDGGNGGV